MLRHRREDAGAGSFRANITALNIAHGTPNTHSSGYHHTITIASLRAAQHVLDARSPDEPLVHVLAALVAGEYGRSDWILAYWTRELLFSVEARRGWLPPDLAILPF